MLESVAGTILMAFLKRILVNHHSAEWKDVINVACSMGSIYDESLGWMSRCVSRAIITGIHSIDLFHDVSSLVPIKQTELESSYKMTRNTSQFTQILKSRARYISELLVSLKQEMNYLVSFQEDEILLHTAHAALNALREKIEHTIHEIMNPGENLHRELCCLYGSVTSQSRSDLQQYVDCSIRGKAKCSVLSSQLTDADFQTTEFQNIAVKLVSESRYDSITAANLVRLNASKIVTAAVKIEIGTVVTKFSEFLCDRCVQFKNKGSYQYM